MSLWISSYKYKSDECEDTFNLDNHKRKAHKDWRLDKKNSDTICFGFIDDSFWICW